MKKVFFLIAIWVTCSVNAQLSGTNNNDKSELPKIIPPSPTVANLMQFEEVPVSHYTGQPNISIPLYSKSLTGDLGINIALSYNTQGVKINNRSGWVGTGWSLEAGGVVSRTVRGLPDEKKKGDPNPSNGTGVFHNDDFWNYDDPNYVIDKQKFLWEANGCPSDKYDYELDLFQFNILGLTGRFTIVKDISGNLIPKLLTKNQNINIEIDYNALTYELHGFKIRDTKGYVYYLNVKEEMTSETAVASTLQNGESSLSNAISQSTNAWYLEKIEMSNSERLAKFNYTNVYESFQVSVSTSNNEIIERPNNHHSMVQNSYNSSILKPKSSKSIVTTYGNTKKLTSIEFRDDQFPTVFFDFQSNSHPEAELQKGAVLKGISIKNQSGGEKKKFSFGHEVTDRLWLTEVTETAGGIANKHILEYVDKASLPAFDSPTDKWGYNPNGESVVSSSTCARTSFDKEIIKKGLLKKIIYPTGGVKEFVFEHNRITYQSLINDDLDVTNDEKAIVLHDSLYKKYNPDNWDFQTFSMDYYGSAVLGHQLLGSFTIPLEQEVIFKRSSVNLTFHNGNTSTVQDVLENSTIKLFDSYGEQRAVFNLDETEVRVTIPPGTYVAKLFLFDLDVTFDIDTCLSYNLYNNTVYRYVYGGGVRIKEIIFKEDNQYGTIDSRKISYDYTDENDEYKSSGAIDGDLLGVIKTYKLSTSVYVFSYEENVPGAFLPKTVKYFVTVMTPNADLTQGSYVGYKRIKVSETNNGCTVYTYTSPQDYANKEIVFNYPYAPAKNLDFKRGLLLQTSVFKEPSSPFLQYGDEVNRIENTYIFDEDEDIAPSFRLYQTEDCRWRQFYKDYSGWINVPPTPSLDLIPAATDGTPFPYSSFQSNCVNVPYVFLKDNLKTGWAKLATTNTTNYFYDASGAQNNTSVYQSFVYNDSNYQIKEQETNYTEKGITNTYKTIYYYPVDISLPSGYSSSMVSRLNALNKINEVLATEQFKNGELISTAHTQYFEPETDLVLPNKVIVSKGNEQLETRVEYHKYDSYGNPLEVSKVDGTHISYIWGYNNTVPVAKIVDATYADVEGVLGVGFDLGFHGLTSTQASNLRNQLSNAQVTTFTYDPLVGVTSVTDPKGYVMYYEYDAFGRLEYVKDKDNNILSKNEYNYRQQN